jgi:hypothetical protein
VASIDSMTFDQPAYNPGDLITLDIAYTPDTPSVVPTTFTATAVITDSGGNQVASSAAPFIVNVAQPAGDVVSVTDDGNRAWTETPGSDTGSSVVFTATA